MRNPPLNIKAKALSADHRSRPHPDPCPQLTTIQDQGPRVNQAALSQRDPRPKLYARMQNTVSRHSDLWPKDTARSNAGFWMNPSILSEERLRADPWRGRLKGGLRMKEAQRLSPGITRSLYKQQALNRELLL